METVFRGYSAGGKPSAPTGWISRFNATVEHLVEISPTFRGIPASFLRSAITKNEILRCQFHEGEMIIREGDSKCDYFFALLSGRLIVCRNGKELASIEGVCSFGTIGYFMGKRSADVIAADTSTVLMLRRQTIEKWPDRMQSLLHENLARELSSIIEVTNNIISSDARSSDKISNVQKKLLNLGI